MEVEWVSRKKSSYAETGRGVLCTMVDFWLPSLQIDTDPELEFCSKWPVIEEMAIPKHIKVKDIHTDGRN